jgi:hypothetical protein
MHAGEAAKTGGSVKKRPPRSACLWPLSLGKRSVGGHRVAFMRREDATTRLAHQGRPGSAGGGARLPSWRRPEPVGRPGGVGHASPTGGWHAPRRRGGTGRGSLAAPSSARAGHLLHRQTSCDGVAGKRLRPAGLVCAVAGRPCAAPGQDGAPSRPAFSVGRSRPSAMARRESASPPSEEPGAADRPEPAPVARHGVWPGRG